LWIVLRRGAPRTVIALLLASLASAVVAAAASRNSIRIALPMHIGSGAVRLSVTGHASGFGAAVWLLSQHGTCSSSFNAETYRKHLTSWITDHLVHDGSFRVRYLPHITGATVEGVHFCAYLTRFVTGDKFVTEAYESLRVQK
jgi:hypothetical protein